MKTKIYSLIIAGMVIAGSLRSQTICDSIRVDSIHVTSNWMSVFLYNETQNFIVYPGMIVVLNANPYLSMSSAMSIATYLDVAGGSNGGVTEFIPNWNVFTPANLVPLNTVFTGTAYLSDPNNSSFSCAFPIQFTYGTMVQSGISTSSGSLRDVSLFPNPAETLVKVSLAPEQGGTTNITITNLLGEVVSNETQVVIGNTKQEIQLPVADLAPGTYFVTLELNGSITTQKFLKQ